ncbi:hypothetical protein CRI94_08650 [Longibacter salinarum]|uniref:Uncharacterized protein n=1 Tax=Longibacter salinarum TaxID=1850348 RepID=A0A2A8CXT4_9BACT|nr:hypothetical protein [Longibacter salinarum]PEN13387.1 hypothetical protein CRI94_08650 [Longibacter salinarum]
MIRLDTIWTAGLVVLGVLFSGVLSVSAQPTVDGDLTDVQYTEIGTKQNSNNSFSNGTDVQKIVKYADSSNDMLYLGIVGAMSTSTSDGIGVWINILGPGAPDGRAAGTALAVSGGGHYIGGSGGTDFSAAFDVDAMYAFNTGSSNTDVYFDAANVIGGTPAATYVGSMDQSGTSATGTGPAVRHLRSQRTIRVEVTQASNLPSHFLSSVRRAICMFRSSPLL